MDEKKTIKDRFEALKTELHWKKLEAQTWMHEHRDEIVGIAVIATPGLLKLARTRIVNQKHKDEERHRNRSVYDPVHHHSYECKRDLKPYEWAEIDRRRDRGESVYDILESMHLL